MKEFDLRLPVARWMIARGLTPIMEMHSMRNCDMVGVKFKAANTLELAVAVELKLKDRRGVIRQATNHKWQAHEIWAAMPAAVLDMRNTLEMFIEAGVGLLIIDRPNLLVAGGGIVREVIPSPYITPESPQYIARTAWRRRHEYQVRMIDRQMRRWHREPEVLCPPCSTSA